MNPGEELPRHLCKIQARLLMLLIAGRIQAARPLVAEIRNEVGDYGYAVLATLPRQLHSPTHLFSRLNPAAIEVSPSHPVAVGRGRKMRAIDFNAGKLLVSVSVDVSRTGTERASLGGGSISGVATATIPRMSRG